MPITPTWQPEDPVRYLFIDARWEEYMGRPPVNQWRLEYATAALTLEIGSDLANHQLLHDMASPPTPVTMLGTEAEMRTSPFGHLEFWVWYLTDPDGLSVLVSGTDPEIVERYARGLTREPREIPVPFEVGLLPEGFVPITVSGHQMEFAPTRRCCLTSYVAVSLMESYPFDERTGRPVTVGGNPAEVLVGDSDLTVQVPQPDGFKLRVSASFDVDLDEAQVIRIAESVTITPAAIPYRWPDQPR
jgi:hypothetical protein